MTQPGPGPDSIARADQTYAAMIQAWRVLILATVEDVIPATQDPMRQWATLCQQILAGSPSGPIRSPGEVHFAGLLAAGAVDVARALLARGGVTEPPPTSDNGLSGS
jgi:hypothetical protein